MAQINSGLLKTNPIEAVARRKVEQRGPSSVLTFPRNLGAHGMLMRFFTYTYGGVKGSEEIPVAEIMLPLPKQLQDSFKINVGSNEIGLTGSTIAGAAAPGGDLKGALKQYVEATSEAGRKTAGVALGALGVGTEAQRTAALDTAKTAIGNAVDGGAFLLRNALNKIVPDAAAGIGVGRGNALNPFATLVFNGVDLKVHNLEWTLSPESEEESRDLKKIIRTLQRMSLPETSNLLMGSDKTNFTGVAAIDRGLLKYPAMVNIYLMGVDESYYFRFKTSMISQLNVDYSPGGIAIQKGGKPSQIGLTMTLNEAFIHTAEDNSPQSILEEEISEAIDNKIVDNLSSNDGEAREFNTNTVQTADGQPQSTTSGFEADEVKITRTLPDGSTTTQILKQVDLLNQGFTQEQINGTISSGIDEITLTPGPGQIAEDS